MRKSLNELTKSQLVKRVKYYERLLQVGSFGCIILSWLWIGEFAFPAESNLLFVGFGTVAAIIAYATKVYNNVGGIFPATITKIKEVNEE